MFSERLLSEAISSAVKMKMDISVLCASVCAIASVADPLDPLNDTTYENAPEAVYGHGLDVNGSGWWCSDPVPCRGGTGLFRVGLEFNGLHTADNAYYGRDHEMHQEQINDDGTCVSWTNRFQFWEFHYRFRTVDSITEWKKVGLSDQYRITEKAIDYPGCLMAGEAVDMEYRVFGFIWDTFYRYTDYSGKGIGLPEDIYTEEHLLHFVQNKRLNPSRMNLSCSGNWVRIMPYKTRMSALTIMQYVTPTSVETIPESSHNSVSPDQAGFFIRSIKIDGLGIGVAFDTEEPPPYDVAVYKIHDMGLSRRRPICHVTTSNKFVHLSYVPKTEKVFVQVGNDLGIWSDMTEDEMHEYRRRIKNVVRDRNEGRIVRNPNRMHLVGDCKWCGFFPSMSNEFSLSVVGMLPAINQMYPTTRDDTWIGLDLTSGSVYPQRGITVTNWVMAAGTVIPPTKYVFPQSVAESGRGYRVTIDESTGMIDIQRAYSYSDGVSDECVIEPGYMTLSVNEDRYGVSTDWTGIEYWQKYTNAVPGVIYGNGVQD